MGTFNDAIDHMPVCPRCGGSDLPPPARPTLEVEQDGSRTCTICSTNFFPPPVPLKES